MGTSEARDEGDYGPWILRPEAGVYFKKIGSLNAYNDVLYISVSLELPEFELAGTGLPVINCSELLQPREFRMHHDKD